MASTVYEQVVVGVSVAALVEQIKVTATVAVTVQVRPGDVFPTLDEVVHGEFKEIPNDKKVHVHDGEKFVSHCGQGQSS